MKHSKAKQHALFYFAHSIPNFTYKLDVIHSRKLTPLRSNTLFLFVVTMIFQQLVRSFHPVHIPVATRCITRSLVTFALQRPTGDYDLIMDERKLGFERIQKAPFSAKKTLRSSSFNKAQRNQQQAHSPNTVKKGRKKESSIVKDDEIDVTVGEGIEGVVVERLGDRLLVKPVTKPSDPSSVTSSSSSNGSNVNEKKYVLCTQKNKLASNPIVVGDRVLFNPAFITPSSSLHAFSNDQHTNMTVRESEGLVHTLMPRRNILQRPGFNSNIHRLNLKNIAANIDQLCLVIATRPLVPLTTIDNYLAYAEIMEIPNCLIVINKADIQPDTDELRQSLEHYTKSGRLGYKIVQTSVETGEGLSELLEAMKNKTSVFVGQSGVGKSSLIDAILTKFSSKKESELEAESIRIGDLVKNDQYGAHTTSNARLYELHDESDGSSCNETNLIDSPGIRELSIAHFNPSIIIKGFKELYEHSQQCKYRNCDHFIHHVHVPVGSGYSGTLNDVQQLLARDPQIVDRCQVINAVVKGDVQVSRYFSYRYIMQHLL